MRLERPHGGQTEARLDGRGRGGARDPDRARPDGGLRLHRLGRGAVDTRRDDNRHGRLDELDDEHDLNHRDDDDRHYDHPTTGIGSTGTDTGATTSGGSPGVGDPAAGKGIFVNKGCGSCHTLEAAGTSGNIGPNLDEAKPSLSLAVDRVTNGKGAMPSFKGTLSDKQIRDVTTFVVNSTGGG